MLTTLDRQTSITIDTAPPPRFAQDQQTLTWVLSERAPDSPSRQRLLTYAQQRIAALTAANAPTMSVGWRPVHPAVASFAMSLLNVIIDDGDLATPQVAPTPDGGLDIQWLVSGDALELSIDLEDGVSIVAQFDSGDYAFTPVDWDFDDAVDALVPALVTARTFLEKISTGIQHRIQFR